MSAKYDYEANCVMLRGDFCMCTYQNMGGDVDSMNSLYLQCAS